MLATTPASWICIRGPDSGKRALWTCGFRVNLLVMVQIPVGLNRGPAKWAVGKVMEMKVAGAARVNAGISALSGTRDDVRALGLGSARCGSWPGAGRWQGHGHGEETNPGGGRTKGAGLPQGRNCRSPDSTALPEQCSGTSGRSGGQDAMRPLQGAAVPVLGRDRRSACLVGQQKTNKKQCSFTMLPWVGKLPPEKEMATGSSILAWKIPWAEEPGGLQSMGSQRVRHYRATNTFICFSFRRGSEESAWEGTECQWKQEGRCEVAPLS